MKSTGKLRRMNARVADWVRRSNETKFTNRFEKSAKVYRQRVLYRGCSYSQSKNL